ncbi:esterase-like activity of phytase family protein [Paracoccus marinaquae]|uniref:Esterase-like activity of phytase family protein n=1 Tax=Paracoccus marinaquae TaxID=2841926 RepID=A0ABS6AFB0_9RHOB|nr:esterase-like activity of phytase family protein [Paracoccus marinaquae]MBU3028901.1 esterase-like activity of phytase family protein [Paracoccus marinaquae]
MFLRLTTGALLAMTTALPALAAPNFNRIAAFPVADNAPEGGDRAAETSSEIIAATEDGNTLVYTDSPAGAVGLIDIADAAAPKALGRIALEGEPTSVTVIGRTAFIGLNTSDSYAAPSGQLLMLDLDSRQQTGACDLGGQPDSVAAAKDGSFIAVAIENERNEDAGDGGLPQMPAGFVVKLPVTDGAADCAALQKIDLTGLAAVAPEDPEPEFVDVNGLGEIVVTLQENNEIVVIGADGQVANNFSAGTVSIDGIDTEDDGRLDFTSAITDIPREPDAVNWIDDEHFAIANEGDWQGGSRGWTIFRKDGTLVHDSGNGFERAIAAIGHFPEGRADNKGVEPKSIEFGIFDGQPLLFVGSERGSAVGVYDVSDPAAPQLLQLLPSGVGPEGYVVIPGRNLLVSANETDLGEDGLARSHVMLFQRSEGPAAYPMLTSAGSDELIGWGALSGLAADPARPGIFHAVSDSVYGAQPRIFTIDASQTPARITAALTVTRDGAPAQLMDMEGIASDGEGGFWIANEGRADRMIPHGIMHVGASGEIDQQIGLPDALSVAQTRFGFEGIAQSGDLLWMPQQREWKDDPAGMTKLVAYNTDSKEWGAVRYPLEPKGEGWMGLSEIVIFGDFAYIVERDNLIGDMAAVKKIFRVRLADMVPAELGGELPVVAKEEVRDLIPYLTATGGYVVDKVEGLAIDAAGNGWVVTDNDGVDDSSGETLFFPIGPVEPAATN